MSEKKKLLIVGSAFLLGFMIIGGILLLGYGKNFDADGYVQVVLDQTLKGDVKGATEIVTEASEKELHKNYEKTIENFVDTTILSGVELDEKLRSKYVDAGKDIFRATKYEVVSEKRIKRNEYEVKVSYEPTDIMQTFIKGVGEYSEKMLAEAEKKYDTTDAEEIKNSMSKDFLKQAYNILCDSVENASYKEKETFVFIVKADEKAIFEMEEEQISKFIEKILCLDEIQD